MGKYLYNIGINVHGLNNPNSGAGSIDLLRLDQINSGFDLVIDFNYGWMGALGAAFRNDTIAKRLARVIENESLKLPGSGYNPLATKINVTVFGHSNGVAIMHRASKLIKCKRSDINYVYINGALKNTLAPSKSINKVMVFYTPDDKVVKWSKYAAMASCGLLLWGDQGAVGYIGHDTRISNINLQRMAYLKRLEEGSKSVLNGLGRPQLINPYYPIGHSGVFEDIKFYGPLILSGVMQILARDADDE